MDNNSEQDSITVVDYLKQQEELERIALEKYPGKFDCCSYKLGYIRQNVYVCRTCSKDSNPAGICYSCSIMCHTDHDIEELHEKRGFRCDCGNSKFQITCHLESSKEALNENNEYNHNFDGLYCWCEREYDPENEELNTMLQCYLCEDWFHTFCIKKFPSLDTFDAFICKNCVTKNEFFLQLVDGLNVIAGNCEELFTNTRSSEERKQEGHIQKTKSECQERIEESAEISSHGIMQQSGNAEINKSMDMQTLSNKRKSNCDADSILENKRSKLEGENCFSSEMCKHKDKELAFPKDNLNLFLSNGWKQNLCLCPDCKQTYVSKKLPFLLNEEETYTPEEEEPPTDTLENAIKYLSSMGRVEAINSVMAYNKLRDEMVSFLEPYREAGKIVTAKDIHEFFEGKLLEQKESR